MNTVLKAPQFDQTIFSDSGIVISLGYNLASDNGGGFLTGLGDQINTDPLLGPLQNNGGPTFTHALSLGSLAINAGDPNFTPPPSFDQRATGFDRVAHGRIDIGSFEVQGPTPTPTCSPAPTPCDSFWAARTPVPYQAQVYLPSAMASMCMPEAERTGDLLTFYDDLRRYDPGSNSWTVLAHSPDAHALSQAVYFKGKIYSIGGCGERYSKQAT